MMNVGAVCFGSTTALSTWSTSLPQPAPAPGCSPRPAPRGAPPGRRQVDHVVGLPPPDLRGARGLEGDGGDHLLHHRHDVVVVGVGLVAFEHRVLGAVLPGEALVAEDAADP